MRRSNNVLSDFPEEQIEKSKRNHYVKKHYTEHFKGETLRPITNQLDLRINGIYATLAMMLIIINRVHKLSHEKKGDLILKSNPPFSLINYCAHSVFT